MPDDSPPPRRYDDREVALILKRAVELNEARAARESGEGMSLAELEQIARETGLDPAVVRRAAMEVDAPAAPKPNAFLGAPSKLVLERTIDGEVPVAAHEELVAEIRRTFDDAGYAGTVGRTLTWNSIPASRRGFRDRRVTVTVTARGGRTTIRVEESMGRFAQGLFGITAGVTGGYGGGAAMGIGMTVFHSAVAAATIWGGLLGAGYLVARTIYGARARKLTRQLEVLLDRLTEGAVRAIEEEGGA